MVTCEKELVLYAFHCTLLVVLSPALHGCPGPEEDNGNNHRLALTFEKNAVNKRYREQERQQ